jgi:mono/diheme cytochrome c family protein
MKISNIQRVKRTKIRLIAIFSFFVFLFPTSLLADGGGLFKAKCATCHQPHKNGTGPKLFEARKRWEAAGEGDLIVEWVKNNAKLRASGTSARAKEVFEQYKGSVMTAFTDLKDEEVISILDWVDAQPDPAAAAAVGTGNVTDGSAETTEEEEGGNMWMWIILSTIFFTIILSVGGVRRQLKISAGESSTQDDQSYLSEFKTWAWKYRLPVGLGVLVLVLSIIVTLFQGLYRINVVENYQPSQPIAFPHDRHAGVNGIDCKYCHNSVTKSKSAGIPTVNVCMNCHKQISGEGKPFAGEIKKIYAAAGWDPSVPGRYTGKTKPIVWNKVHALPDHVYFNHSQHVVVGGIDCKQCHGDMTKMNEAVKVQPVAELNKIEGNIKLTKPTLTMGWCIECHGAKNVSLGDGKNGYYDEIHRRLRDNDKSLYKKYLKDGKVSVSELGGWECAKCHY